MASQMNPVSRCHDLFAAFLGAGAALVLASAPWQVDTSGPEPFYKGPLIFPILVLSLMIVAALPAAWRLARPARNAAWQLDGGGWPIKTGVMLGMLVAFLIGMILLGLAVSSWGFLFFGLYYLGHRTPLQLILIPLVVSSLLVLIFKYLLGVFFPTPLLVNWFLG